MDLPQGPVAIIWDIENCTIPSGVRPEEVAINIRTALGRGTVTMFSAYGDFHSFPRRVREGCQRTGVKLIDVPNGRKDAADKAILVDMFLFALDNRPPSSIMLISGDVDFAQALHILGQRGYTIILVIPSGVKVSSALRSAGRYVWDWHCLACGMGLIPSARPLTPHRRVVPNEISGCPMQFQMCENQDTLNEEATMHQRMLIEDESAEKLVYSKNFVAHVSNSTPPISKDKIGKGSRNMNEDLPLVTRSSDEFFDGKWEVLQEGSIGKKRKGKSRQLMEDHVIKKAQKQNIHRVKGQLIKLLGKSGGCLALSQIPQEFQKYFGQPLRLLDCDVCDIVDLLRRFSSAMTIEGEDANRFVCLKNSQAHTANNTLSSISLSKEKEGGRRDIQLGNEDMIFISSDEFCHDKRDVLEKNSVEERQKELRGQLVMLLKHSGGFLAFNRISQEYHKLFGQPLLVSEYGARKLEALVQKFSCVMTIMGRGSHRLVYLKRSCADNVNGTPLSSLSLSREKEGGGRGRGRDIQNGNEGAHMASRSCDELLDDKREVLEEKSIEERQKELMGQLITLLEHSGGFLAFNHFSQEYHKLFGEQLHVSEYGACKLEALLQKFSRVMMIKGRGAERIVYFKNSSADTVNSSPLLSPSLSNDKKGEGRRRLEERVKRNRHSE